MGVDCSNLNLCYIAIDLIVYGIDWMDWKFMRYFKLGGKMHIAPNKVHLIKSQ